MNKLGVVIARVTDEGLGARRELGRASVISPALSAHQRPEWEPNGRWDADGSAARVAVGSARQDTAKGIGVLRLVQITKKEARQRMAHRPEPFFLILHGGEIYSCFSYQVKSTATRSTARR